MAQSNRPNVLEMQKYMCHLFWLRGHSPAGDEKRDLASWLWSVGRSNRISAIGAELQMRVTKPLTRTEN
jgi:hypothetical protein